MSKVKTFQSDTMSTGNTISANGTVAKTRPSEPTLKPDLRQKDLEAWSGELSRIQKAGIAHYNGGILRAAVFAGWFESPVTDHVPASGGAAAKYLISGIDVADMMPWQVNFYARYVERLFSELTEVPGE